ncbi:MAG: DUF3048 domain-containing protein [Candidatus Saccharimonadales bacterium]
MQILTDIKYWFKRHWIAVVSTTAALVVVGAGTWVLQIDSAHGINRLSRNTSVTGELAITEPAPLTGVEVDPSIARRPVIGVMIENSPDARPQSGLDSAGVVFEAVAEGGITRFLALYQDRSPSKIGPIRSLRPYYVDWFMGFDAAIAHVGGSAQALNMLPARNAKTLNQFAHSGPYYRSSDRYAPHNMYSSITDLRNLAINLGYRTSSFKEIPRSEPDPVDSSSASRITINYSSSLYQAQFRYDPKENNYIRYMAGSPHIDRETGEPIRVENVVIINMPSGQNGQYVVMDSIGSSSATLFKDGRRQNATWRQTSYNNRIELLDSSGKQIPLAKGDTWFAILTSGRNFEVQ